MVPTSSLARSKSLLFFPCLFLALPHLFSVAFFRLFSGQPRPWGQLDSLPTPPLSKHVAGESRWIGLSVANAVLEGAGFLAPSPAKWQGDPLKHDGSTSGAHRIKRCAFTNPVSFLTRLHLFILPFQLLLSVDPEVKAIPSMRGGLSPPP